MGLFDIFRKKKRTYHYQIMVNGKVYKVEIDISDESIEKFYKNRNSEKSTPILPEHERVDIDAFIHKYIRGLSIPEKLFEELQQRSLDGFTYADIPISILKEVERNYKEAVERDEMYARIATLNNEGIKQEKAGNIEAAIDAYMQNVSKEVIALHPYERLMAIYRKRKEYDKEIEVIEKAIDVFTEENERRARQAIANNPSKASEIEHGLKTCTSVYGNSSGRLLYYFQPYDVNKYKKRLEKSKLLKQKHAACFIK